MVDEAQQPTSEVWNVADAFIKLKIFKPMYDCDKFETIAQYGVEDINQQATFPQEIPTKRIEALYRFKDAIRLVIENSNFIIKKADRKAFDGMRNHLNFVEEMLDAISSMEENQVTHEKLMVINEEHFGKCLKALQKLKEEIHTPLNNSGIIFKQSEEMSFEELQDDIVESG